MTNAEKFLLVICIIFGTAAVAGYFHVESLKAEIAELRMRGPQDIACDGRWFQVACPPWAK